MKRRTRVAEGVYRDRYGLAATVKVGRIQREQRFPPGTELETVKSWRTQMRATLDDEQQQGVVIEAGTLQHHGDPFIARKHGQQAFKADRAHLRAWYPRFGTTLRSAITRADVEQQISAWLSAGVAARTIRHRCRVLRELYRAKDGPKARTPVDHLKLPKPPAPRPIAVPLALIRSVAMKLAASPETKTYVRFLVRATTGQRPAQIMRAIASDIDYRRKLWFVRSAKGGHAIPFPLNAEAVQAWKLFAKANAWGVFDTGRDAELLRRYGWPKDIRPYALRSTFAIDLLLNGADLGDVQGLLGHAQIETTRSHYAPVLAGRLRTVTNTRALRLVPAVTSRTASTGYQRTSTKRTELLGKRRKAMRGVRKRRKAKRG